MTIEKPEDLEIHQIAEEIAEIIWNSVTNWGYFEKDTLGKQFVRAADSMSLNISEGYGRFFYNDKKLFYYYSRGSLYETQNCLQKAFKRNLIDPVIFNNLTAKFNLLLPKLNKYIQTTGKNKQ
jgi:four helix bundle protein